MHPDHEMLSKFACPDCGKPVTVADSYCPDCKVTLWQPDQTMKVHKGPACPQAASEAAA